MTAYAENVTKIEKNYDIAVVFDNSGSMYKPDNKGDSKAWCRAKYAMEIFASMLNYDKDKLHIFPMWEVTTDGSQPSLGGSYAPIEIKSKKDIDKISNLYTVRPSNTPFAPITEAYNYLKTSGADEKWLIVLTDGAFNQEARGQSASIDLQKRLSSLSSTEIKVQYLGFGDATALNANEANNFFAKKSSDTSLKDDLIGICNSIFQRSVLPGNRLNGEKLNLDLSMKNVIVFAQGVNAKITSLKNSDGKEIAITLDSGQRKYSNIKATGCESAEVDTTLAGQVVTFDSCPKGEYTLTYSGADAIQIFYEPDVKIDVSLINGDGQKIEKPDDFVAGEYTITSKIVDASTGEDVTSHELMGKDVKLKTYVKTSKDSEYKEYTNGSKLVFEPDDRTEIYIEGEYLGKYKINSKDDPKLAWLFDGFSVEMPKADFKIEATVLQPQSWYILKDHNSWEPIKVTMMLEGQALTDEQMANTKLTVVSANGLKYRCEPILSESAYNIYIAQGESGEYFAPESGKYKLEISAVYTDEDGNGNSSNTVNAKFEIQEYSLLVRQLIIFGIVLLVLLILAVISLILHKIKVLPNHVDSDNSVYKKDGKTAGVAASDLTVINKGLFKKSGSISVRASKGSTGISLSIEAIHPLFKWPFKYQKPNRRKYRIVGINANNMDYVKINGTKYTKETYSEVKEIAYDQTSVEFGKNVGSSKYYVKTDLVNK